MNAMLKLVVKCLKCCLWCFEKTVRYTHYGYTDHGYTYHGCTYHGFTLVLVLTMPGPHHPAQP